MSSWLEETIEILLEPEQLVERNWLERAIEQITEDESLRSRMTPQQRRR
jgi:hypothetical protein